METLLNLGYIVAVIFLTTIVLTNFVQAKKDKKKHDKQRLLWTAICGLLLGALWFFWFKADPQILFISWLASMALYRLFKKYVYGGFEQLYDNGRGKGKR